MAKMSPPVVYAHKKIRTMSRTDFVQYVNDLPIRESDRQFLVKVGESYSAKQLAEAFNLTIDGANKRKRHLMEIIHQFDRSQSI